MPERRMAAIAFAFALGILSAQYVSLPLCALIAALVTVVAYALSPYASKAVWPVLGVILVLGAARYTVGTQIPADDISRCPRGTNAFEGTVVSDPDARGDSIRLVFRASRAMVGGKWRDVGGDVMVNLYTDEGQQLPRIQYGDRARISANPYPPMDPTNPGGFSWKDYLARKGIYTAASVRRPSQIRILESGGGNPIVRTALGVRGYLVGSIYRLHPKKEASVVAGVALGTYAYLPRETYRSFARTGTLHILAASGYNCYVLLMFTAPVLSLFKILPKWRNLVTIGLIGFYVAMVGPAPSLVRAAVMATLLLLAPALRRVPSTRNTFFAAAFVVLMITPSNLFDVGFQLSFAAVWALIAVSPIIEKLFMRAGLLSRGGKRSLNSRLRWLSVVTAPTEAALVGTVAISLVTAPVVAYHFNNISLSTIPANMAVAVVEPLIFFDGLVCAVTAPLGPVGTVVGVAGTAVTRGMLVVVDYLGSMRYSAISVASPGILAILGYYLVLSAGLAFVRSRFDDK